MFKLESVLVFYGRTSVNITGSVTSLLEIKDVPTANEIGKMLHKKAYWNSSHIAENIIVERTPGQRIGHIDIPERITASMNGIIVSWKKED